MERVTQKGRRILMRGNSANITSEDFPTRLASVAEQMEATLAAVLPTPEGHQSVIMEAMRYAALGGGKRLRPFLMVETARMLGYTDKGVHIAAAALECLHVYSLVHDDLPSGGPASRHGACEGAWHSASLDSCHTTGRQGSAQLSAIATRCRARLSPSLRPSL